MAKKTKITKKHRFKHAEANTIIASGASAAVQEAAVLATRNTAAVSTDGRNVTYIMSDLRRLSGLLLALVALELVIWVLFNHTGVGPAVYGWIQV